MKKFLSLLSLSTLIVPKVASAHTIYKSYSIKPEILLTTFTLTQNTTKTNLKILTHRNNIDLINQSNSKNEYIK